MDKIESIGYGSLTYVNDGAASAYVVIDNVISADPPAEKLNTIESKRLSIANRTIVHVGGLFDPGDVQIQQQFTQAGFTRMETLRKAGVAKNLKFTVVDDISTSTAICPVLITQNKTSKLEADKITEFTTTARVTGVTVESVP